MAHHRIHHEFQLLLFQLCTSDTQEFGLLDFIVIPYSLPLDSRARGNLWRLLGRADFFCKVSTLGGCVWKALLFEEGAHGRSSGGSKKPAQVSHVRFDTY